MPRNNIVCLLAVSFFALSCGGDTATDGQTRLRFAEDGTFKILQLTDLHWNDRSPLCDSTAMLIREMIGAEHPRLVVLTGDVVTAPPARGGWERIAAIMAEAEVPWAVTLGNHDDEADMSRRDIFEFLDGYPLFVGNSGPDTLSGQGNYVLAVDSYDGERTAALLWFLDSHNKPAAHKFGHYDWIRFDQMAWYREASRRFTIENGGLPLPSLMFFHIPLREYASVARREHTGNLGDGIAASGVNSGLFSSLLEMQDVMCVFTGHDHDNDFIGKHLDVALAYGRVSGYDAGSQLQRGARVIMLREGEFGFDTWIRTQGGVEAEYFFPSGITALEESDMEYLPATEIEVAEQGVDYVYYEGRRFRHTADIAQAAETARGRLDNISIDGASRQDSMAFVFTSWIKIPERGVYNFYTYSDDGSVLYIDGRPIVDNDGGHSLRRRDGKVALDAGFHHFELRYFEDYMGQSLEAGWSGRRIRETPLPDKIFWIRKE